MYIAKQNSVELQEDITCSTSDCPDLAPVLCVAFSCGPAGNHWFSEYSCGQPGFNWT
jgi:hypothetical protein